MIFGENLKRLREQASMTQFDLEIAADLPLGVLSQYENSHREPRIENLRKLKNALDCTWQDLLTD